MSLNEIHCRIAISQFFESYGRTRACAQRADANWACGLWPALFLSISAGADEVTANLMRGHGHLPMSGMR